MSQIITITSEALQATIRRLLPSQQGFGEDLQASNVILPIIDVTPTAEGSQLPVDLARAANFSDITTFSVAGGTSAIANTPGFYRVLATSSLRNASSLQTNSLILSNGLSNKTMFAHNSSTSASDQSLSAQTIDEIVFLTTGDSLTASSSSGAATLAGSIWQVADRYGNINNPADFTFE